MAGREKILIGTAGWSYPDWAGIVYPKGLAKGPAQLRYLADFVDCVEINNTFYRPPAAKTVRRWVDAVSGVEDFIFNVKLWRGFTHESGWTDEDVKTFREGIEPMREAGRLGAILVQYPWSFQNNQANREALHRLKEAFPGEKLVLEIRHVSWNTKSALDFITENKYSFANIDQPESKTGVTGTDIITGPVGYVRMHGRNRTAWFDADSGRDEKYNYLYSSKELNWWVERVKKISSKVGTTFIILNNHFQGKSLANSIQIAALLGKKVRIPDSLIYQYPELEKIDRVDSGQRGLFG
jgi:uncharacterized protein YecE (DUF72 family)